MDAISHNAGWFWSFATGGPGGQQFPAGSFSSAGHSPGMQQEPPKSNFLKIFLIVAGILLLICCGCGGLVSYLGYTGVQQVAGLAGKELIKPYEQDPAFQQHIGNVKSATMNISTMMEDAQKNPNKNNQATMFIDVEGDKGKGQIIGKADSGPGNNQLREVKLRLPTGEEFPLTAASVEGGDHEGHDHGDGSIKLPEGTESMPAETPETSPETTPADGSSDSVEPAEAASN